MLETLAAALGDTFTDEVKEAWTAVYGFISTNMVKGANESLLILKFDSYRDSKITKNTSLDVYISRMQVLPV